MNKSMRQFTRACQQTHAPIVLLFTKKDLFMRNLHDYAVPKHLPNISESTDPDTFFKDTLRFFTAAFQSLDQRPCGRLYIYWINAVDADEVKCIFRDIHEIRFDRRQSRSQPFTDRYLRGPRHNFTTWSAKRYKAGAHGEYTWPEQISRASASTRAFDC